MKYFLSLSIKPTAYPTYLWPCERSLERSSSFPLRARECRQKGVPDQRILRISCSVPRPEESSLDKLCRQTCETKAKDMILRFRSVKAARTSKTMECFAGTSIRPDSQFWFSVTLVIMMPGVINDIMVYWALERDA